MLYPANDIVVRRIAHEKMQTALRQAEIDRLLSEVNPRQPSWLSRKARQLQGWLLGLRRRSEDLDIPGVVLPQKQDAALESAPTR
jgi:hypothetical protein